MSLDCRWYRCQSLAAEMQKVAEKLLEITKAIFMFQPSELCDSDQRKVA
jgi:hypothetical protein